MSAQHPSFSLHGPAEPRTPLVLDSPHSGTDFPADFAAVVSEFDLRDGEDCYVDALWMPATERGVGMLAASVPRTYIDYNRHAGDIDLELIEGGAWPDEFAPSGKAALGKALIWRTLDDGRPIYARKLGVAEVRRRIEHYHRPYHHALHKRIEATHAQFGASWHIDCHSMNAVGGAQGEGGAGKRRADIVLGDRDGSTCDAAFTEFVRAHLAALGYDVRVNDPYKGVELVRAYSDPATSRMSLQLEVNKRLYMDEATRTRTTGFSTLQAHIASLVDAVLEYTAKALAR
ncbi:MAG: N-formylglutamate amidohydrolase [Pseudomonadota bacterium]|nr:N-formylglutamate amidohydrolase [Pseudomonadota bacterium]